MYKNICFQYIDITKKIMEAMKSHDKVASEIYKLVKAKMIMAMLEPVQLLLSLYKY